MATSSPLLTPWGSKSKPHIFLAIFRPSESKAPGEFEHWQINEMESLSAYPLDYRITKTLQDKCHAVLDVKSYLENTYTGNVAVEFEHV